MVDEKKYVGGRMLTRKEELAIQQEQKEYINSFINTDVDPADYGAENLEGGGTSGFKKYSNRHSHSMSTYRIGMTKYGMVTSKPTPREKIEKREEKEIENSKTHEKLKQHFIKLKEQKKLTGEELNFGLEESKAWFLDELKLKSDAGFEARKEAQRARLSSSRNLMRYAFYFYMFFGVQNLFGLNTSFLGDMGLPYLPEVIVGTMPFYSAQRIERGMSDRIIKYRAIGDIFLAHQRGSTDTLRIDMTLFGPYRGWYLLYLLALQQGGESVLKQLPIVTTGLPSAGQQITIPKNGEVQYESHMTFPIITKTAILLDMFLQTIEWHQEQDKGGHDIIYTHLLFRKHIEPLNINIMGEGGEGHLVYGATPAERKRRELLLDTMWKAKEIGMELIKTGLFGSSSMIELDAEAVMSDPYITDIAKLVGGYSFDINNMASIIPGMGG